MCLHVNALANLRTSDSSALLLTYADVFRQQRAGADVC
jgi:hypothetical protein